ncbi:MAG TPA: ATP-dependent Clp protease proteolytic subunit [Acidimicrobiales bacterium]
MPGAASAPDDPRFPRVPPEVPFPPWPRPAPPVPPAPPAVPVVPVPAPPGVGDDLRSSVYERLLGRRTVILDRTLDAEAATLVAAQLVALDQDSTRPVTLVVNCPGGPLDAVGAVLDTIDLVRGVVDTTCLGRAVGTGAVVLAAGTGRRRIGASAQVRLRLAEVELAGTAGDLGDEITRLRDLRRALVDRLAAITGQDRRLVERDVDQGRALSAAEAVAYGLVDEVIEPTAG